jgi:hypothetical protein
MNRFSCNYRDVKNMRQITTTNSFIISGVSDCDQYSTPESVRIITI